MCVDGEIQIKNIRNREVQEEENEKEDLFYDLMQYL